MKIFIGNPAAAGAGAAAEGGPGPATAADVSEDAAAFEDVMQVRRSLDPRWVQRKSQLVSRMSPSLLPRQSSQTPSTRGQKQMDK